MRRGRYDGVTAYVGMPGSGKTYALAEVAARAMRQGRRVFCNAGFDVCGAEVFGSFEEFCALPNGVVVVWDELPLYVNARKWSEFPDGLLYRLTQIRKDGLQLYYSAIDEAMVDVNVRRVTFWYWRCRAITGRWLTRTLWPPESYRRDRAKPYRREVVHVRGSIAGMYDSWGKVAVAPEVFDAPKRPRRAWIKAGNGLLLPEKAGTEVPAITAPEPEGAEAVKEGTRPGRGPGERRGGPDGEKALTADGPHGT